jgi:hypothetical protein
MLRPVFLSLLFWFACGCSVYEYGAWIFGIDSDHVMVNHTATMCFGLKDCAQKSCVISLNPHVNFVVQALGVSTPTQCICT